MPNDLFIPGTASTPEVAFRFSTHQLELTGECYPENAQVFFEPLLAAIDQYLDGLTGAHITLNIRLAYFNSASTKILLGLFNRFSRCVVRGNDVVVNWFHDEDDDTILEFGHEIADEFPALVVMTSALSLA